MKKNLRVKTVIIALALIIFMLAGTVFADGTVKFSDIEETAFYRDSVYKLVNNGVLNGYPDGTFRPFDTVTRAEMCKMINLTFGYTDTEGAAGFSDLVPNEWYIPYVLAGQKAGYVQGDDVGTFRPNDPITREEVCAILCRIIQPYDLGLPVTINDAVSDWAKDYVRVIVMNSIIPTESGNFRATENMKRYELALAVAPYSNVKIDIAYCTVYFKNGDDVQTRTVEIGKTLKDFPTVNTNIPEGKKFVGWTLANPETDEELPLLNNKYIFNENKEIYAYAVFENADCTVKFMAGDILVKEEKVKYGNSPTPPANNPERVGKKFSGWAEQGTSEVVDITSYKVLKDVVLTAVFVSDSSGSQGSSGGGGGGSGGGGSSGGSGETQTTEYTVSFCADGIIYEKQTVEKGKYPKLPQEPKKEGYKFLYWSNYEDGDQLDIRLIAVKSNVTYYAVFAKLCKVVFIVDGETVKESTEQAGKTVRAPKNPTKEGFIFKHWSKTVDGKDNSDELQEIKDDLTLYAVFEKEPEVIITHTVKFFANGKEIANKKVNDGNTVDPPTAPKKDGFLFRYWGLSENGNEVNLDTYAIKEDTDIYAIYEKEIEYFSVKFYSDGALFFEENNVAQGSAVPLPSVNPEKEGHSFQYWSKTENGSAVNFSNYTVEQNETFYAVYEKNTVYYSVKFYSDGEIYFENSVAEGTTAVAPENNPEKDGHSFKYWSKAENGSAVSVNSYAVNEDTVFYAVFEKEVIIIKYQIRFYNDTELLKTETVVAGETATPPADPEREKFDFLYWSDAPDGDEFNVSGYAVDDDKDFYAVFRRKENPNDPEIINALKKALQDVSNIKLVDKEEKQVRSIMKQVLNDVIAKSETTLIDKNFVKTEYKTQIDQIKSIVKGWDNNKRSRFITTVSNEVDADTMDILMDYFLDGADVSQYI